MYYITQFCNVWTNLKNNNHLNLKNNSYRPNLIIINLLSKSKVPVQLTSSKIDPTFAVINNAGVVLSPIFRLENNYNAQ